MIVPPPANGNPGIIPPWLTPSEPIQIQCSCQGNHDTRGGAGAQLRLISSATGFDSRHRSHTVFEDPDPHQTPPPGPWETSR